MLGDTGSADGDTRSDNEGDIADRLADNLLLDDSNCDDVGAEANSELKKEETFKSKKKQMSKKKKKVMQSVAYTESEIEKIDLHEIAGSKKQKKKLEREKILTNTEKKLSPRTLRRLKQMLVEMKPSPPEPKYMTDLIDFTDLEHRCTYCNQSFVSKNKLFKHLNSSGHAMYVPKETAPGTSKSSRNRR